VSLHLLDLGGRISGNGLAKLFLGVAAAFAQAECDRNSEMVAMRASGPTAISAKLKAGRA
jgi:hypothetical protein